MAKVRKPRQTPTRRLAPGAKAMAVAKAGIRYQLKEEDVRPGCIAWMPWAGVIKVTHKDRHRGSHDGVKIVGKCQSERPGRRAWNHPVVIVKRKGERVLVLAVRPTTGKRNGEH